jgi:hypothetical protein
MPMGVHVAEPRDHIGSCGFDYRDPAGVVVGGRSDRGDPAALDGDVDGATCGAVADVNRSGATQNRALAGHLSIVPVSRVDQSGGVGLMDPM